MVKQLAALALLALSSSLFAATTGIVLSPAGDPVAGAEVVAYRLEAPLAQRARLVAGGGRVVLAKAVTDDGGAFSLGDTLTGVVELIVQRDGFVPERRVVVAGGDLAIEVRRAGGRVGRVVAEGKAVEGAVAVAFDGEHAVWQTTTDAKGAYTIPDPKTWVTAIAVLHPDYAIHHQTGQKLDVTLRRGERVTGTTSIANATLLHDGWPVGTSGDDGTFVLAHLPASATVIDAIAGAARGRGKRGTTIRLDDARTISGTIRDADKRPLAGAAIRAWSGETAFTGVADEKGNYRFDGLTAAAWEIAPEPLPRLRFEVVNVSLAAKDRGTADFNASEAKTVHGTVVDERKRPIAGADVRIVPTQIPPIYVHGGDRNGMSARTGRDGRFELALAFGMDLAQIGQSMPFRLQAVRRGYAAGVSGPLDLAAGKPVTIVLPEGIELTGSVVDADGKPVAGAGVVVLEEPFGAVPLALDAVLSGGQGDPFVETDAEGRFSLRVNAKPHDVGAWKERYAGARVGSVKPGGEPVKLVLESAAELRGRVVQQGSDESPRGMLTAMTEEGRQFGGQLEADGTFIVKGLRPGDYTLQFVAFDGTEAAKRVQVPAANVVIELPALVQVRGRVLDDATGEPVAAAYTVSAQTADLRSVTVEGNEPFAISLRPGPSRLTATAPGYAPKSLDIQVEEGKTSDVVFRLVRARRVTGRITDDGGLPVEGAYVALAESDEREAESDADGAFVLDGVPLGAQTLAVTSKRHIGTTASVPAGESDERVDVVLRRGVSVRGHVILANGEPVENAQVHADTAASDGEFRIAVTDANGAFTIEGLIPARYELTARRHDLGESDPVPAQAPASEVVIALKASGGTGVVHGRVLGFQDKKWEYGMVTVVPGMTSAMIGRDGRYRLERVPAGEVEVRAFAGTGAGIAVSAPPVTVTVGAGAEVEADLAFRDDIVLRGTVTEKGQPAPAVDVRFMSVQGHWAGRTDARGVYEITGILPGQYNVFVGNSRRSYETEHRVTGSGTFDISIDRDLVSGRVVDADGKPIVDASIELARATTREVLNSVKSDGAGAFSVELPAGEYIATASAEGYLAAVQRVQAGAPFEITLNRGAGLEVRLVDARTNRAMNGYVVAVDANGTQYRPFETKDVIHKLPLAPGSYRVSASADGYASQSMRVTAPAQGPITFPLTPGGTLVIRTQRAAAEVVKLVMPNGEEYVQCHCNGIAAIRLSGPVTTVPHVAPGSYTMQVLDGDGRVLTSHPVTIIEGQTATAEIHVPQ